MGQLFIVEPGEFPQMRGKNARVSLNANISIILKMEKRIEKSNSFMNEQQISEEAFLKLNSDKRTKLCCVISEMMIRMQYENGVLPGDNNFTLTK